MSTAIGILLGFLLSMEKVMKKICGIYKIINKKNGKFYVGSSRDVRGRWHVHKYLLINNKHHSIHLQRAWKKYGKNNFEFILVKECSEEDLLSLEQTYLDIAKNNDKKCYNVLFEVVGGTTRADKKVYTFYHDTGLVFRGTRMQFRNKFSLDNSRIARLINHGCKLFGWSLAKPKKRDTIKHTLYHKNGISITGNRRELREQIRKINGGKLCTGTREQIQKIQGQYIDQQPSTILRELIEGQKKEWKGWSLSAWNTQLAKVVHQ